MCLPNIPSALAPQQIHRVTHPAPASTRGEAGIGWGVNSPEPLTGYKLYYKVRESSAQFYEGTGLNEGSSPILLDKVTTFKMTGLAPNETYHFVLTGYNERGESEYKLLSC